MWMVNNCACSYLSQQTSCYFTIISIIIYTIIINCCIIITLTIMLELLEVMQTCYPLQIPLNIFEVSSPDYGRKVNTFINLMNLVFNIFLRNSNRNTLCDIISNILIVLNMLIVHIIGRLLPAAPPYLHVQPVIMMNTI